jgi:hypothetical protein
MYRSTREAAEAAAPAAARRAPLSDLAARRTPRPATPFLGPLRPPAPRWTALRALGAALTRGRRQGRVLGCASWKAARCGREGGRAGI